MIYEAWHIWVAAALILLIAEIFVPGFILACLAIGAVGGAMGDLLGLGWEGQTLIASLTATLSLIFIRPIAMKAWFSGSGVKTGTEALIGRTAEITTEVDPQTGFGRCKIDGDDWKMEFASGSSTEGASKGTKVKIKSVESAILIVENIK